MYFAEEVIDGRLCWRTDPNGPWTPYTAKELTARLMSAERQLRGMWNDHRPCETPTLSRTRQMVGEVMADLERKIIDLEDQVDW